MEVKDFTFELKAAGDERTIEGMGSVFHHVDNGNDIVMPGAFAKTLKARSPAMLWQHKSDQVIGVWDEVRETDQGLYVKGRILETALGNDAYTLAKAGALKGMSIGYGTKDASIDKKTGVRQLKELDLWEVSLVTFPMNERAGITRVKSAEGGIEEAADLIEQAIALCEAESKTSALLRSALTRLEAPDGDERDGEKLSPKSIERILREAGMSRSDARGVLAKGYTAIATPREAGGQEHEKLIHLLNQFKI